MTLLLGPPSGGKSVLLQALSGRLRSGRNLRVSGRASKIVFRLLAVHSGCISGCSRCVAFPALCTVLPSASLLAVHALTTSSRRNSVQISGSIKYNGMELDEFQPRRVSTAGTAKAKLATISCTDSIPAPKALLLISWHLLACLWHRCPQPVCPCWDVCTPLLPQTAGLVKQQDNHISEVSCVLHSTWHESSLDFALTAHLARLLCLFLTSGSSGICHPQLAAADGG